MEQSKIKFIEFMMESGVLIFGDFTTKSGRKTPYFVNTGNYRTGKQLYKLGEFYAECVYKEIGAGSFDIMFGPAYKGIPLATVTASSFFRLYGEDKAVCFNRKEFKDHGESGILIGQKPVDGDRVVIIEDVITAGTAVRETMPILKAAADVIVKDMFISVDRCEVGQNELTAKAEILADFGISVHSIVNVADVAEYIEWKEGTTGSELIPADTKVRMREYMGMYCKF